MLTIEETFRRLAEANSKMGIKTIIITDRGTMDPAAYMEREKWLEMLTEMKLEEPNLRDNRYDVVVHMTTAALGAESFYTTSNNNVRSEGVALARDLDKKILEVWNGHAYLDVVGNETGWNGKLNRVVQCVLSR